MFTVFNPELAGVANEIRDRTAAFADGRWDPAELAEFQLIRLRQTLRYVRARSPFYRDHLRAVEPDRITSPDALDQVPLTTKEHLRAAQWDLPCKPLADAWIYYETTGTTGRSTPCPRDNVDSLTNNTVLTLHYGTVFRQLSGEQVVGISGPTDLHAFGDTFAEVCRNLGIAVVKMWPHAPTVGFERAIEVLRDLPVTGLFCTPGMALTLAKKAIYAGIDPDRGTHLSVLMLTGELSSPALLETIGRLWGARAYNALYATQETSVLGAAVADGRLCAAPLLNYYEVVDPSTALPVRERDGTRTGELVVTSLYQGAKPLVRYRTGDLVRLSGPEPGQLPPAPTLEVLGRVGDELVLNDRPITGYDLESLVLSAFRRYLDYQIVIDSVGGVDCLTLRLEVDRSIPDSQVAAARARCREALGTDLVVVPGHLGAITATGAMVSWKAARVIDNRHEGIEDPERAVAARLAATRDGHGDG